MDLGPGLYVTIVGMGLVFFSLAVLMVAIILLDRLFPNREPSTETSREENPRPERAPTASSAVPEHGGGPMEVVLNNQHHRVEVEHGTAGQTLVLVDGRAYQAQQRGNGATDIVVDGQVYPARVTEVTSNAVTVRVGNEVFRVEFPRKTSATPAPAVSAAPSATPGPALSPAPPAPQAAEPAICEHTVVAPMPGKILRVSVTDGDHVVRGQELCTLDAMKMENSIRAPRDGTIRHVLAQQGQIVKVGQTLAILA